jgi:hypothetical protein
VDKRWGTLHAAHAPLQDIWDVGNRGLSAATHVLLAACIPQVRCPGARECMWFRARSLPLQYLNASLTRRHRDLRSRHTPGHSVVAT